MLAKLFTVTCSFSRGSPLAIRRYTLSATSYRRNIMHLPPLVSNGGPRWCHNYILQCLRRQVSITISWRSLSPIPSSHHTVVLHRLSHLLFDRHPPPFFVIEVCVSHDGTELSLLLSQAYMYEEYDIARRRHPMLRCTTIQCAICTRQV